MCLRLCTPGEFFHYPIQSFGVPPSPCILRLHCLSQDVLTFVIATFLFYLVLFLVLCSGHLIPSALLPCLLHPLFTFPPFVDCVPRLFRNPSLFSVSSFEIQASFLFPLLKPSTSLPICTTTSLHLSQTASISSLPSPTADPSSSFSLISSKVNLSLIP